MSGHDLAVLRVGVRQDVLDEVITILVACDIDQGYTRAVDTSLTHSVQVANEKFGPANLQALLHDLGGELIHRVLRRVADDVINRTAAVCRGAMLADVLDAPIAKLAMSHDVDVGKDLLDAGALERIKSAQNPPN